MRLEAYQGAVKTHNYKRSPGLQRFGTLQMELTQYRQFIIIIIRWHLVTVEGFHI